MNTQTRAMHPQSRGISQQWFGAFLSLVGGTATCLLWLAATVPAIAQGQGSNASTSNSGSAAVADVSAADYGGGGHTETAGNNLSVPVIWTDTTSAALTLPLVPGRTPGEFQARVTVPWSTTVGGLYAYAQKTLGNVWQAQNRVANGKTLVDEIDWGDMLESAPLKLGTPIRIELTLYKLGEAMQGFAMAMLANPSSPEEVQGVTSTDRGSAESPVFEDRLTQQPASGDTTVYSPNARLVVQKLVGTREAIGDNYLLWDGTKWTDQVPLDDLGVEPPQTLTFGGEVNVGGKVIYGLSKGGWRANQPGDYRITFYLPPPVVNGNSPSLEIATIRALAAEEGTVIAAEETGGAQAVVKRDLNLTYIDVRVASTGGGGGGRK